MKLTHSLFLSAFAVAPQLVPAAGQGLHDRIERRKQEPATARHVEGGVTFSTALPVEKCFNATLNFLKRHDYAIDSVDRDAGQIATALDVKGGYSQTGTRVLITLIKDSDTQTSVRVTVTRQKRKKLLQTEPWSDPNGDDVETAKIAADLKVALNPTLQNQNGGAK